MAKDNRNMKGTYFISSISITPAIAEFGISSIFILFLLNVLHLTIPLTSTIYAYYYGFAYLLPILIGYIADKYLNKSTALVIGFVSMIISQLFLSFASSLYYPTDITYNTLYLNVQNISYVIGLFFLALGTGLSTLAITHIINSICTDDASRLDGFSIYYPVMNIGVLVGVIIMTILIGNNNHTLYEIAFLLFALLLTIGLFCFTSLRNKYLYDDKGKLMIDDSFEDSMDIPSNNHESNKSTPATSSNSKQKIKFFHISLDSQEKYRLTIFFVFLIIIVFYRIAYSQSNSSMVYFIKTFVERNVGPFEIPVQFFSVFNPLFILIFSPIVIIINNKLEAMGKTLNFINRSIIALLLIVVCFAILAFVGYFIDVGVVDKISLIWVIVFEFFIAMSELYFSISSYSMVGNLAPADSYALFFGLFTATRAVAMFFSGIISSYFPKDAYVIFRGNIPVNGLMSFFLMFVVMNLLAAVILICYRKKLREKLNFEDFN